MTRRTIIPLLRTKAVGSALSQRAALQLQGPPDPARGHDSRIQPRAGHALPDFPLSFEAPRLAIKTVGGRSVRGLDLARIPLDPPALYQHLDRSHIGTVKTPKGRHMTVPQQGEKAPAFRLARDGGATVALSDFKGRQLVLVFYPTPDTPG